MPRHVHSLACVPHCTATGRPIATRSPASDVRPGVKFWSAYADDNVEWIVLRRRAGDVWVAEVAPRSSDWAGAQQIFTTAQIRAAVKYDAYKKKRTSDMEGWYESLRPGQIVHYNNGFGEYVRSKVVKGPSGQNVLQPIALVGSWREHDLPHYTPHGVQLGLLPHYPAMIAEHATFRPNWANIYEAPAYAHPAARSPDPTHMAPINLQGPRS